jgi:hypothetical protein
MSGNGAGISIIGAKPKESEQTITFVFSENGDLARIDGNVNLSQLLIVAFEATQLAVGIRGSMMMQQMQNQAALQKVAADLAKEGKHGRE